MQLQADAKMTGNVLTTDIKKVSRALIHLNMIKTNVGMYPPEHARIRESVDSAYKLIQEILINRPEVTIGVAGDALMLGESVLDRNNAALRDYARSLNKFLILAFSLEKGVTREELLEFNRLLSSKAADVRSSGNMETVLAKRRIAGIKVKDIDADVIKIAGKKGSLRPFPPKQSEDEYLRHELNALLNFRSSGGPEREIDPAAGHRAVKEALEHLNKPAQWRLVCRDYEDMLREYFRETSAGGRIDTEKYEALSGIRSLFTEFHPALKKQLIEAAERQLSLQPDTERLAESVKGFPREMLVEMVRLEGDHKGRISPSLLALLKKMTGSDGISDPGEKISEKIMSSEEIGGLLKREAYEKYVPNDYETMLKKAADAPLETGKPEKDKAFVEECLKTLTAEHIVLQLGRFILRSMDEGPSAGDYLAYSQKLKLFVPELLSAGRFDFLTEVVMTLRRHAWESPSADYRPAAVSVLNIFSDKEAMARQLTSIIVGGEGDPLELATFLTTSGPHNIPWLLDLYLDPPSPAPDVLIEILKGFGKPAYDEAFKRLADPKPERIMRLLTFFRALGDRSIVSSLHNLFEHEDFNVKREAIRLLVDFEEKPAARAILRGKLSSPDPNEVFYAVNLICSFGFDDLFKEVASLVKTFLIREEDAVLNEFIVSELGSTGNPAAVAYIKKIAAIRLSLSPKRLERMKRLARSFLEISPKPSRR